MAMQFNLLPWREEKRRSLAKRNTNLLLFGLIVGLLLGLGYYGFEKIRLSDYDKAFRFISQQNKKIEPLLKEKQKLDDLKTKLDRQIQTIESLQANRASVSHMVEELSNANTQQLYLTEFTLIDGEVNIVGIAENDTQISDLMKRLRESQWYQEPKLLNISSMSELGEEIKQFSISSQLLLPGKKLDEALGDKKNG